MESSLEELRKTSVGGKNVTATYDIVAEDGFVFDIEYDG